MIIQGHPDPEGDHFCNALADAYARGANAAAHEVRFIEVARLGIPFLKSREDQQATAPEMVARAQDVLSAADHIIVIYPVWNGGPPAVLRAFLEQVFRPTFIFPDAVPGERLGLLAPFRHRKALTGKTAHIVATMAMPGWLYRVFFRPHVERNVLAMSGVRPIRQTFIGRVEALSSARRTRWLDRMRALGVRGI